MTILIMFSGCGPSQAEYDKLKTELNECKFGAEKLIAAVEKAYSEKKYVEARKGIANLAQKHPESPKNVEFAELLKKIHREEPIENAKKAAEEKERNRLANLNNTGIWSVNHYVDDFGEETKQAYLTNTDLIRGSFSNTATQNSALDVKFLINSPSDITLQLFKYARNNPVKAYSSDSYTVLLQDKDGNRLRLRAVNYSDRLSFENMVSKQLHSVLLKGGTLKFKIIENDTPTTEYEFIIQNADLYENAYELLKKVKIRLHLTI